MGDDVALRATFLRNSRKDSRSRSGSIILEFALTFRILLITFLFAWQVINVFIYDVLGQYAAFSAARSYSVFRDYDGLQGEEPTWLARDVAAAVMAPYAAGFMVPTSPAGMGEVVLAFPSENGVGEGIKAELETFIDALVGESASAADIGEDFIADTYDGLNDNPSLDGLKGSVKDAAVNAVRSALDSAIRSAARDALSSISAGLVDGAVAKIPVGIEELLNGRGPKRALAVNTLLLSNLHGESIQIWRGVRSAKQVACRLNPTFRVTEYGDGLPEVHSVNFDGTAKENSAEPQAGEIDVRLRKDYTYADESADDEGVVAKVACVSFTYDTSMWIGFTRFGYLKSTPDPDKPEGLRIPVYNSCACPIEPRLDLEPEDDPATFDEGEDEDSPLDETLELADKQNVARNKVLAKLDDFYKIIYEKDGVYDLLSLYRWDVTHWTYLPLEQGGGTTDWDVGDPGEYGDEDSVGMGANRAKYEKIDPEHHPALNTGDALQRLRQEYSSIPPHEAVVYDDYVLQILEGSKELLDPDETMRSELKYREGVEVAVNDEIDRLAADLALIDKVAENVAKRNRLKNDIENRKDDIEDKEDDIEDKEDDISDHKDDKPRSGDYDDSDSYNDAKDDYEDELDDLEDELDDLEDDLDDLEDDLRDLEDALDDAEDKIDDSIESLSADSRSEALAIAKGMKGSASTNDSSIKNQEPFRTGIQKLEARKQTWESRRDDVVKPQLDEDKQMHQEVIARANAVMVALKSYYEASHAAAGGAAMEFGEKLTGLVQEVPE